LYPVITTAIRFSILCLYYHVFSTAQLRRHCYWVGALSIVWFVVIIPATTVVCLPETPDRRLWGAKVNGYCFNYDLFALLMGIVETIIDTIILVLPIKLILSLKLVRRDKVILICVFLVGILLVVSVVSFMHPLLTSVALFLLVSCDRSTRIYLTRYMVSCSFDFTR
jgi:hypothetical protein